MADSSPAFAKVTANDHSAGLTVTNVVLILFSGIVVITKTLIRYRTTKLLSLDNIAIFTALALAIGQSVTVQIAVNHGLGTRERSVSHSNFVSYSKANYAAQILYVAVLAFTKLSITQLIQAIQPQRSILLATHILMGLIGVWAFTSVFALAFGCHLPGPWLIASDRCVALEGLYDYIGVLNMITDITLVVVPIPMLWKIQISPEKKLLVIGLFAVRIIVPPITIVQLVYFHQYFHALDDQTWSNTNPWILTQVVMNMSIITACIPSLRRVVTELSTNQTSVAVSEGMEFGTMRSEKAYGTGSSRSNRSKTQKSKQVSTAAEEKQDEMPYGHNVPHDKTRRALAQISSGKRSPAWQDESHVRSSQERLRQDNGIMRNLDYSVLEEDHTPKLSDAGSSVEYEAV